MKPRDIQFAYFGTDDVSIWVLEELLEAGYLPAVIITAPPKPKGRKMEITPSPLSVFAKEKGIDTLEPEALSDDFIGELGNSEWDIFVVASYGKILPKAILDIPRKGVLNMHPSLLPKLRGASPIKTAILEDMRETGVTVMYMSEKMDEGPILAQARITPEEWPPRERVLREILSRAGGQVLAETIPLWMKGEITPEEQNHAEATYSRKFTKEDGLIDLSGDPYKEFLKIQALSDDPGAYFFAERNGKKIRVKITDAEYEDGELKILKVIPEGKKEMEYEDFLRGLR